MITDKVSHTLITDNYLSEYFQCTTLLNICSHFYTKCWNLLLENPSRWFGSWRAAINSQIVFQFQVDFDTKMSAIFRILVLTVPSTYSVVYFTFWQTFVTRLDAALGMIMLLIQVMQFFSAILCWWPKVPSIKQTLKRPTSPTPYSRL